MFKKLMLPDISLLKRTGDVDYFDWNYKFPIKYIQRYRFKRVIQLLGNGKYPVLLEAGMGSGILLPTLSTYCEKLCGCDIHSNFDHIHELLLKYKVKDYQLSTQSIQQTNYPDRYFDAIIAVSVLEFVNDLDKAILEIRRILKDDGVFITICPMKSRFLDFFVSLYSRKKPEEEFGESRIFVGKLLEKNFKVIRKGYMIPFIGRFFPVYTHYKLMK
jgi:ubiquinone/menaquinone biosynthesis C-methylase UbiE